MAEAKHRYRKVQPRMWADKKIRRLTWPPPGGLALFQYLMTGRETVALPGALEVTEGGLANRLGWPVEGLREAFAEVCGEGLAKADWEACLVWLPGGPRNNPPESPNVIKTWGKAYVELPECDLKDEILHDVACYVEGLSEAFQKAFAEAFPHPSANQEQEQEDRSSSRNARAGERPVCLTPEVISEEWHEAMHGEDGNPSGFHACTQWLEAYRAIGTGIATAVPEEERVVAAHALVQWFWHAPDGPVQAGRVARSRANPGHLAKRVSTDLDAASQWWARQV